MRGSRDRSRMIPVPGAASRPSGFDPGWAREVLVRHKSRLDPDWLLGSVLRVLEVRAEENPNPGGWGSSSQPPQPMSLA